MVEHLPNMHEAPGSIPVRGRGRREKKTTIVIIIKERNEFCAHSWKQEGSHLHLASSHRLCHTGVSVTLGFLRALWGAYCLALEASLLLGEPSSTEATSPTRDR